MEIKNGGMRVMSYEDGILSSFNGTQEVRKLDKVEKSCQSVECKARGKKRLKSLNQLRILIF